MSGRQRRHCYASKPAAPTATKTLDRTTLATLVGWGLLVWAAVAVSIRLVGLVVLAPATPALVAAVFVAVSPLMAVVTDPVYRLLGIAHRQRPAAAAALSVPGTGVDVLLVAFAPVAIPAMSAGAVRHFGAILPFGYAVVILTGLVPRGDPV